MPKVAYHLDLPDAPTSCAVFASPHSGRDYPWSFLRGTILDEQSIRSSEDAFVDRLFDCAPQFGAPLLRAGAPRAFIDLNRAPDELDPALIEGVRRTGHNPRVASGLGVVPRVVSNGRAIYRGKLPLAEAERRISRYWHPYHTQLRALLDRSLAQFGEAVLIDCHSMPHEAVDGIARNSARRPEIVIGDRFGASATPEIVECIESAFAAAGLTVVRNTPFAGAYVTQAYGRPSRGQHAVQVEIDRSIYMDETQIRPNANFQAFRRILRGVVAEISAIGHRDRDREQPLAAE
ncbi:MAG: N-formylglutamate amidohydrolase [Salipiger thiooxidans]|jgi:N-formylglutamate deformylase|uniref:N-formylglutamate deformylase n=1 Tax=Salipiger thiooxidans TaxID=282683 RepID=A0A1G7I8E6_9RHOB|nr:MULTISPECIES: N-formylglutamate amidohydrolase [Salipiger]EEX14402.1 N-formylglutamate amidohydrolase family protein [Citreicella sp. SE45]MAU44193.1 N-formylglutamate amidohydrolase [Salipiger sp.]MBR9838633.1 N-formylglutamate amidohydrolase [Paracoccaceae bacterium]MAU44963.1 N-formylglutamate amidohydrolase [Salipiger sp.]MBN8187703.1 N-formylglutamate amidohydrolase [Salipiger thiooxidans]